MSREMTGRVRMKRRYVAGICVIGAAACIRFARHRQLGWGSTAQETEGPLFGDHLLESPDLVATRAITVHASADLVWPWIAQLGQGRGGFYSYDFVENLLGCDIHSADRIVSDWQDVTVGDEVKLYPDGPLDVAAVEPGRALVLRGGVRMGNVAPPYDFTWAFVLCEQQDGTTRLLVRERYAYSNWWAPIIVEPAAAVSFVMTEKMLRGIKDRAESKALETAR